MVSRLSATRRRFLSTIALGAAALLAPPIAAFADEDGAGQAEWRQSYEPSTRMTVARESTPTLSQQTIAATEAAIETYQGIVSRGGWSQVPANQQLKIGVKSKNVQALRQRLIESGDLDAAAGMGSTYDSFVEAAVKRFQLRHGLSPTGVVGDETFAELNVSADARLQQLQTNIIRLKSYGDLGERFVLVNIPAAAVETVEDGVVVSHHIAGVGKIDRQSPIMQTKAIEINFNPFWTVPPSLIKKDLIPKMKADPNYLTDEKIRVFDSKGEEVQPSSINWNTDEATHFKYRQDTGADLNSLGSVRINIANPYGVYMHDTPSKGIFGDDFRFVSSGCVRVQDVRDYVAWLLEGHARLGSRPDRSGHRFRPARRRETHEAGAGLLDLCHGLGDARRHRAVPSGRLSARRLGPRPGGFRGAADPDRVAAGLSLERRRPRRRSLSA